MAKRELRIPIECGDRTCASAPGEFCAYSGTRRFGTEVVCLLFNVAKEHLDVEGGWTMRCKECLELELK